jgi:hypothetical protein
MNKKILTVLGALLILVGLLGFFAPQLLGMHLGALHNLIHLVSGCLALYFGTKGTLSGARTFSIVFGAVYGFLGVIGFLIGGPHGMWNVIPNHLMFGAVDHVIHLILGAVFLVAGLARSHTFVAAPPGSL